jgi:hypothetical protein
MYNKVYNRKQKLFEPIKKEFREKNRYDETTSGATPTNT